MEIQDIISPDNNWEVSHSNLNYRDGKDLVEVRLVSNGYCRENGWRRADGKEQWDSVKSWSSILVRNNVGYRILRAAELSDPVKLHNENTPLIIDSVGCVSDAQAESVNDYLTKGGIVWLALPFGTHDEKGFKRTIPLSDELKNRKYKNLIILDPAASDPLKKLIAEGKFKPVLTQLSGDTRWAARIRVYKDKPVIHFLNTALVAIPHPTVKDNSGIAIVKDINSEILDNHLSFKINTDKIHFSRVSMMSPEAKDAKTVVFNNLGKEGASFNINLEGIKVYAVLQ